MTKKAFEKIAAGLSEATDIAKGVKAPARTHHAKDGQFNAEVTDDAVAAIQAEADKVLSKEDWTLIDGVKSK